MFFKRLIIFNDVIVNTIIFNIMINISIIDVIIIIIVDFATVISFHHTYGANFILFVVLQLLTRPSDNFIIKTTKSLLSS